MKSTNSDRFWPFFAVIRGCPLTETGHFVQVQQNGKERPGADISYLIAFSQPSREESMDHQAFAQLLGNYGEFVGALAVVITLAFLTKQLRDSTRSANATAHSQRTSRNIELMRWVTDLDVAGTREKIAIGSEVSPHEWSKVRAVDHATLRHFEDLHYQKGLGLVDMETWEANMRGIRNMCGRPGFRESFEESKFGLRRSFQALVEETLNDDNKTR